MSAWNPRANEIFVNALEKSTAESRAAYLDDACGSDHVLHQQVEALLAAHLQAGSFLDRPAAAPAEPATLSVGSGTQAIGAILVGKYKLVEAIGGGGMGTVYMAQQTEPVKRLVAVKVIKTGLDSKSVLARFDAERQALAMMDHPNIARVFDAGATADGQPFFVMELVKGLPITKFCDDRKLNPRERLELFVQVCQAIQHAHQKGIIHRDIKPSNVLVAMYDDRPVPKVIDFGLAKATGSQLTDHTLVTNFGAVVGTPEYMSPEQASFNQMDVDTRSDVYALGVLLYELLTGVTPVDRKSLGQAAMLEILRIVREVEPPRPSDRLSTSDTLPTIAANRHTDPTKLTRMVRGELDWVAMKALEKDRTRRYDTANALARDIQRFLADEIVEARPPSARYRLGKFLKRNRGIVTAATVVFLALVAGIIGTSLGLVEADQATDRALKSADKERQSAAAEKLAQQQRALAQVNALRDAAPGGVPGILADLEANRDTVLPTLRARFADESDSAKRMRLALALLPIEPEKMRDELIAWMLQTKDPAETLLIRDLLRPHSADLTGKLWHQAGDPKKPRAERFLALVALASFDPASPRWKKAAPEAAEGLLKANALHLGNWVQALHSVRLPLLPPLGEVFRGERLPEYRQVAADVLADYAADQAQVLADLLMDADEKQFATLFPLAGRASDGVRPLLAAEIAKQVKRLVIPDKLVLEKNEKITGNEPKVKAMPAKRYEVHLQKSKSYRLAMNSEQLDSYIVVQDKTGFELAFDDDSGGALDSLLVFSPERDDTYVVFAASFKGTGAFHLKIVETSIDDTDDREETLAKRQANAAVALARMNEADKVWPLLKHGPDPRVRSYLIHRFGPMGADAAAIIKRLDTEPDITIKRALILSLGEYGDSEISQKVREGLVPELKKMYQTDADAGLHAAAEWLLRRWQEGPWLKQENEKWAKDKEERATRVENIQDLVKKEGAKGPAQWYVNGQGQTMVVMPGPVELLMGTPLTEKDRRANEIQHKKQINRTFAIASKAVTMEQYRKFQKNYNMGEAKYHRMPDLPAVGLSWYMAARYCNWLSKEEGIPEVQWCYEIKGNDTKLKANYLSLSGYRLPTEAEMEYATRAGALTARYYGETEELLPKYAWYNKNSDNKPWPVGSLKPNDFGLFDMQGNSSTWCQEKYKVYSGNEDKEDNLVVIGTDERALRGCSFVNQAWNVRSSLRDYNQPTYRNGSNGVRVARTFTP
jgi:serine/threonine protein kinase/formylglycine-generating enzyme required for sulfatase activity